MDPGGSRRKIPRPWLERRQLSAQAAAAAAAPPIAWSPSTDSGPLPPYGATPQPPIVLLERPNPLKSFLKFDWCCGFKQQQKQQQQPQRLPPAPPPEWGFSPSPLVLSQRSHHDSCDSSFQLIPRPTVIYVVQGDPSKVPSAKEIQDQWHQSYLSSFGTPTGSLRSERKRPSVVNRRTFSWDTSCTTLSDDSLAFSDEIPGIIPQAPPSSSSSSIINRPNGIPRPPRVTKAKTAGSVMMTRGAISSPKPPLGPPKATRRMRAATMDSLISTGSRHRRQAFSVDQDTIERTFSMDGNSFNLDDDDDDDDDSLALNSDSDSLVFPLLDHRSSPRSQESCEKVVPEVYLPKCTTLEERNKSKQIIMSGWVAFSKGDSLLHKRRLTRKHLGYLVVYEDEPNEIYIQQPLTRTNSGGQASGEEDEAPQETVTISLPATNVSVQTEECKGGRSVVIRSSAANQQKVLCTILPMNLPSNIFNPSCSKLVRAATTSLPTPVPTFAQHDAALHLWFGLDGWMRRRPNKI